MGQRLNIEIVRGDTVLANCYYHWSAYTWDALQLTKKIVEAYDDSSGENDVSLAVRLLEHTGAGINEMERLRVEKKPEIFGDISFDPATSRDDGLIYVTLQGIDQVRRAEEGRVTIDLASETVDFGVVDWYTQEEYEEYFDEDGVPVEKLHCLPFNLGSIPFGGIDEVVQFVNSHPEGAHMEDIVYKWI